MQAVQEVFHVKLGSDARKTREHWTRKSRGNQGKSRAKDTIFGTRMTAECVAEILWTACRTFREKSDEKRKVINPYQ